ncbi:MAG: hypothetical protein JXA78_19485 [Anaerolineales bacterium]|nr:hypothetical protein [Anaerolineales bacterium]
MTKNIADENERRESSSKKERSGRQPVLRITMYSWSIPIVGLVMLVIGLLGGYFLRPLVAAEVGSPSDPALAKTTEQATPGSPDASQTQAPSQDILQVMEMLTSETRHFVGDPDAPVVIIEFSDFL